MPNAEALHALTRDCPHLHVITGPMLVGKSNRLIDLAEAAAHASIPVYAFKHVFDARRSLTELTCHHPPGRVYPCQLAGGSAELRSALQALPTRTGLVLVDEAQFFDLALATELNDFLENFRGVVACAGISTDYRGRPFGPMPTLLATADSIEHVVGQCARCSSAPSTRSIRRSASEETVVVGDHQSYDHACRACATEHLRRRSVTTAE